MLLQKFIIQFGLGCLNAKSFDMVCYLTEPQLHNTPALTSVAKIQFQFCFQTLT